MLEGVCADGWISQSAKPLLYTVYRNRNRNQLRKKWLALAKNSQHWKLGAEVTSGSRLFKRQLPATSNATTSTSSSSSSSSFIHCQDYQQRTTMNTMCPSGPVVRKLHPLFTFSSQWMLWILPAYICPENISEIAGIQQQNEQAGQLSQTNRTADAIK